MNLDPPISFDDFLCSHFKDGGTFADLNPSGIQGKNESHDLFGSHGFEEWI